MKIGLDGPILRRQFALMPRETFIRLPQSPPRVVRFSLRSLLVIATAIAAATWLCTYSYRTWARKREVEVAAQKLAIPTTITDNDLATLNDYFAEGQYDGLDLRGSQITDDGLKRLAPHGFLKELHLSQTKISDTGLSYLLPLKELRQIHVGQTLVSWRGAVDYTLQNPSTSILMYDQQMAGSVRSGRVMLIWAVPNASFARIAESEHLMGFTAGGGVIPWFNDTHLAAFKGLGAIELLELPGTSVTDTSIELILEMKKLRTLVLPQTTSMEGVERLRKGLPQCTILRW